jgi:hypothetical protein
MNDKYVDFKSGLEDMENYGKQDSEKDQAIRNCLCGAELLFLSMFSYIVSKADPITYSSFAFRFESWKEEKDNL